MEKDDFNGWPDQATQMAVMWFPNAFLVNVFRESLSERKPREWFIREMTREYPEAADRGDPDWGDVFDSLTEEDPAWFQGFRSRT